MLKGSHLDPCLSKQLQQTHRHIFQNLGLPGKALFLKALYSHPCECCRQRFSASCRIPWSSGDEVKLGETPRDFHFFLQLAPAPETSVQLEKTMELMRFITSLVGPQCQHQAPPTKAKLSPSTAISLLLCFPQALLQLVLFLCFFGRTLPPWQQLCQTD